MRKILYLISFCCKTNNYLLKVITTISFILILIASPTISILGANPSTSGSATLQQSSVSGVVVSGTDGQPIPGVNVREKGESNGTVTDGNGKYTLTVKSPKAVLVYSFVGFLEQEQPVNGKSKIDVSLAEDVQELDAVVVVGYGSQKKKDITSAITIIDEKALAKLPVANVANALQGMTAGVEVQGNQGRPGELPTVRVRGVSSTNNTDPLYVIDGIPQDNAYINAEDIESMQVLKDAASSAIYGSRGANGVIIITTKSGRSGAPKISYSGYYGVEEAWKQLDLLNITQWASLVNDANLNNGFTPPPLATDILKNGYTGAQTDWQKEIFQKGAIEENNLDISGGTKSGNYYFSANQYKQQGIIIFTPYTRYSMRMNSNWQTEKFKFGENISYIYSENRVEGANQGRSTIEEMIKITPNIAVHNPNVLGGYSGYDGSLVGHDAANPVGSLDRNPNYNYNKRFSANAYGEYQILKDLTFRTTYGINSNELQNRNLTLKSDMLPKSYTNTTLSESALWTYNWVWENMFTYHKLFGNDHDLTVMGAYTSEYFRAHNMGASGTSLQTETNNVLSLLETGYAVTGYDNETSRISYLGRFMYSYKGKYMVTANMRRDGSSKFGPGLKWGNFPSASIAWRASDESFLKGVSQISNLKIRTSYGVVGNDAPVNAYSYISGLTSGLNYTFNGAKYTGVSVTAFNNANLTWETVKQFDAGFDLGLYKGMFDFTFDYYNKKTIDMLIGVPLPGSSGNSGTINKNIGSILNRGLEFSATFRKNINGLDMSITGNLSTLHNEVLDIGGNPITAGAVEFGNATRTDVGHPIGAFYGYKMLGVFKDQAAIDAYTLNGAKIQPAAKPGDVKFADLNNNGSIDTGDQYFMGSPIPTLTYGVTANFAYKGFDLSLFLQGVDGNQIYAELVVWTQGMHTNFNEGTATLDRWTPTHTDTNIPRAVRDDPNGNIKKISDRYMKDGAYLRLKNVSLGYTIPKAWNQKLKISNLRVYVTGRNLLTFTKYPFYDPEIGSNAIGAGGSANTSRGIDNGYYPQSRTIITGIQLDF